MRPATERELADLIGWAAGDGTALELIGGGSKRSLGRPIENGLLVDLTGIAGVVTYEPNELVLTVRAGTRVTEIEELLHRHAQHLAFEPLDLGPLWSDADGAAAATIGGIVAAGASGPRRLQAGAVRDHVLGMTAVTGRGEAVSAGGRVVKNVTGYDLPKLLTGSYGSLAAFTEITLKVLPAPEKTRTILIFGLSDGRAQAAMSTAMASPHDVSGAAHLPQRAAGRSRVGYVKSAATGATAIRVEGFAPSVAARADALKTLLGRYGAIEELRTRNSVMLWREIRHFALIREPFEHLLWRLSLAPAAGPQAAGDVMRRCPGHAVYDWGGGLVWLALDAERAGADAGARMIRRVVAEHGGGHATLIRAPAALRRRVAVFEPQPEPLAALTMRIKESFDPQRVLGPGRMYEGV